MKKDFVELSKNGSINKHLYMMKQIQYYILNMEK